MTGAAEIQEALAHIPAHDDRTPSLSIDPGDTGPRITRPQPDIVEIRRAIESLFPPDVVVELRAFSKKRRRTDAGFFDGKHREDLAKAAVQLNGQGAVYVTLNPVDSQLVSRYANRIEPYADATTTDKNIIARRWFLIDVDPVRPKNTSATDDQLSQAKDTARAIFKHLRAAGWPDPVTADSGNGVHLLYRIDLPNDKASCDLIRGVLEALAQRFDTPTISVDRSVFNAARIIKLYGTIANKGDHTDLAPWRLSRLTSIPDRIGIVTPEQLQAIAPPTQSQPQQQSTVSTFDLAGFMGRLGIDYQLDHHDGRERYKLERCPFNPDHGRGEAAIFRAADGALGFKCQHNSCADRGWKDVRALVDGPAPTRRTVDAQTVAEVATVAVAEWPEPAPMSHKAGAERYPLDALPGEIGKAIDEVQRFVKAPVPLVTSSALGALSAAAQSILNVRRANQLSGPCSLFLLSVAESGERKTTIDRFFTEPIKQYQAEELEAAKPKIAKARAELSAWEAKRAGALDAIKAATKGGKDTFALEKQLVEIEAGKPTMPRIPELLRGDDTPEALAYDLANRWPAGAVISSEAGLVFGSAGMAADRALRNLALLNVLWDGGELPIKRRTGDSFTVRGARLTLSLQLQESALMEFFRQTGALARGTGFLARFLVACPDSTQGFRPYSEAPATWPHLSRFNHRLLGLLREPVQMDENGSMHPRDIDLSPEAKQVWISYHDAIEESLRVGGELSNIRDIASKSADNAARIAALFHVYQNGPRGSIDAETFQAATRVAAWHLNESLRFFGGLALPQEIEAAQRLEAWLIDFMRTNHVEAVHTRTVLQYGPSSLRSKPALSAALAELEELGRARLAQDGKQRIIQINPKVWGV